MQSPVSLKSAERKAFQATFMDGLWDVFLGCFALEFAVAPLLSESLGDFWSSAIFLPFWGLAYLAIHTVRKHVVQPRIGTVSFGKARKEKMRRFSVVMVAANLVIFLLGLLAMVGVVKGVGVIGSVTGLLGLFLLAAFSIAAYMLDFPRLYVYGLLAFAAPLVGEWLYQNRGAAHHGFPIVFGFTAAVMIVTGLVLFFRLLKNNPVVELPDEGTQHD
jgi:hypothetical protein